MKRSLARRRGRTGLFNGSWPFSSLANGKQLLTSSWGPVALKMGELTCILRGAPGTVHSLACGVIYSLGGGGVSFLPHFSVGLMSADSG